MKALYYILIFSLLASTQSLYAASNVGVFMIVKGKVEVSRANGKTKKARMGMKVYPKDIIQASKNARAKLVMADKNVLNVSPESKFQLTDYKYAKDGSEKSVTIDLIYGKIRSKVKQKYDDKKQTYRVKTKAAVAGVRGTDFIVSHGIDNKTKVVTFSGAVSVGSSVNANGIINNPVHVKPGQMTIVSQNTAPEVPKNIPKTQLSNIERESEPEINNDLDGGSDEREPANQDAIDDGSISDENNEDAERDPSSIDNSIPPPPPPPIDEEQMLDISYNDGDLLLNGGEQYNEMNPLIDDIIQQSNTSLNITIVAPE